MLQKKVFLMYETPHFVRVIFVHSLPIAFLQRVSGHKWVKFELNLSCSCILLSGYLWTLGFDENESQWNIKLLN